MASLEGKKVKNPPDSLLDYELCKHFGWTPQELYEQDNRVIEEFVTIMNAVHEFENGETKKARRGKLRQKMGGVDARGGGE